MANIETNTKRVAISKASAQMVAVVGVASFFTVFSLFATHALFTANSYRSKVIKQKEIANKQLTVNLKSFDTLVDSYKEFDSKSPNAIGGSKTGTGDKDGNNAKIVLDALPNSYDFPALASSLEKVLGERSYKIASITGIDDQINQEANSNSPTPKYVEMPFSFSVKGAKYESVKELFTTLQHSIRPIQVDKITLNGNSDDMTVTVDARSFYQPAKNLNITKKVVK
ncbi:MAG: hypothetical protein QFB86_04215 [Patescibacteria group bacterium]|nr:hypothetical protein [Patescibacteria group bacterium]